MSIGIRLHDVAGNSFEDRLTLAKGQGFQCIHLALSKVMGGGFMRPEGLTPGLASYVRRAASPMDVAVLGCYLNLAHPDEEAARLIRQQYIAHLRFSAWLSGAVVGTETGNPNADYRYDPVKSHSADALKLLIDRLAPVVDAAQQLGAVLAIEPVFSHIVCDARRAREVLDSIHSPNLQIILDPVNLLDARNLDRRDDVIREAVELLIEDTAVLHIKDYIVQAGELRAAAPGQGMMDYRALFSAIAPRKPHLHITLEDTQPENAVQARAHILDLWLECSQRDQN